MRRRARFCVLLGSDFSGKSSVLREVGRQSDWVPVSYDDEFVPEQFGFIRRLKPDLMRTILPNVASFSPEMLIAWLHVTELFIRDASLGHLEAGRDVIVDSYFYKMLSKCVLRGMGEDPVVKTWRSFPRPDRVIFLRMTPEQLDERVPDLHRLNVLEHYEAAPSREGFLSFQRDLQEKMLVEVHGLPLDTLDGGAPREMLVGQVMQILAQERGRS
jgi:thymidylate kinase